MRRLRLVRRNVGKRRRHGSSTRGTPLNTCADRGGNGDERGGTGQLRRRMVGERGAELFRRQVVFARGAGEAPGVGPTGRASSTRSRATPPTATMSTR